MKARVCDKCGKVIYRDSKDNMVYTFSGGNRSWTSDSILDLSIRNDFDLCSDCYEKVNTYIKGEKKRP